MKVAKIPGGFTRGAEISYLALSERLGEVAASRTLSYNVGEDVVVHPKSDSCRVAVHLNRYWSNGWKGVIVHPVVEVRNRSRATGKRIGWVCRPGQEQFKNYPLIEAMQQAGLDISRASDIAEEDMHEWYKSLAVLLFPSVNEYGPRTVVEASAYGVPVLAARSPWALENPCYDTLIGADDLGQWLRAARRMQQKPRRVEAEQRFDAYQDRTKREIEILVRAIESTGS